MKDFFSTIKFKLLAGLVVVLAGMMAYAGANGRLTAAPQELLGAVMVPFQRISAALSGGVSQLVDKYARLDAIIAENEALKEENAALRNQLVDYDRVRQENESFQSRYNIEQSHPEYTYASGFVIGRDPLEQFFGFTIDKGTRDEVERGDIVVSDQGYLVGRVIEANFSSAKVLTILSPSLNAAGVVSRTRDNGILTGDSAYAPEGVCLFTNLSRDTLATVGDQVITTGLGGVFPPDILVGTIRELVPESSGKSTMAVIQPGVEIETLTHVFVITSYDGEAAPEPDAAADAQPESAAPDAASQPGSGAQDTDVAGQDAAQPAG